jgi:hypothetical protein
MKDHEEAHFGQRKVAASVSDIPVASRWLTLAEDTRARQTGFTVSDVRDSFASKLKVPAKTLRLIRGEKRKSVPHFLMSGIRNLLIEVLHAEIRSLEHEIAVARQVGMDCREDAFEQASASIAAARKILEDAAGSGRARGGRK